MSDVSVARQFGANLRIVRKRAGLSQEEVGARALLHRTEIGLLERGARVPRIDTLIKLTSGLGVGIDCLLDGITWRPGTSQAGGFEIKSRKERRREEGEGSDSQIRAEQEEEGDAVAWIRKSREELDERAERWKGNEEPDAQ
jgi:transcriptional regulator with XRE-family HTH domain